MRAEVKMSIVKRFCVLEKQVCADRCCVFAGVAQMNPRFVPVLGSFLTVPSVRLLTAVPSSLVSSS